MQKANVVYSRLLCDVAMYVEDHGYIICLESTAASSTTTQGLTSVPRTAGTPTTRKSSPTTESPSPSSPQTPNCTNASANPVQVDTTASEANMDGTCREPCTVSFCTDKARICSATGYACAIVKSCCLKQEDNF